MILVDSSIWIDHFRFEVAVLADLLIKERVLSHPIVIGEVALGQTGREDSLIVEMSRLPAAETATDDEVLDFIRRHALAGAGIGYADAHLLAAVRLTDDARLWTRDRRLLAVAQRLDLDAEIEPYRGLHED